MKRLFYSVLFFGTSLTATAQWANKTISDQGTTRDYRIYVSPNYNAANPASLVLTLHGLGDNMTNFSQIGFNYIADTANIIVVVPQAVQDPIASYSWNSGAGYMGYFPNTSVNDVQFISNLLDSVSADYAINQNRMYACGFSMGGFMTNRLALELNDRFAAYGSVSGTIGNGITSTNVNRPINIVHFHGTADQTVGYYTDNYGLNADSLVHFWTDNDNITAAPAQTALPDTQADGYTIDYFHYGPGTANSEVEHYRVNGADHTWLTVGNDVNYTVELWKFFNKHQGIAPLGLNEHQLEFTVYPNPATELITLTGLSGKTSEIKLVDAAGRVVFSTVTESGTVKIDRNAVNPGNYLLNVTSGGKTASRSIAVR